ncbi:MAG TPA: DUF1890 domain-containing protein [Methanoregulaceae archaeon]|nr:DUF1890 domain-containing protein [Methanoregulaceae archaeon]
MTVVKGEGKNAALVLGCPQVPIQTGIALYLVHALKKKGVIPVIAGNRAARMLVEVSDPARHYIGKVVDIDRYIADLAENVKDYNYHFVFIHNDAGVTYAATIQSLSQSPVIALIYGEHYKEVASTIEFPCEKIAVKAVHNPMPLKKKIDEVLPWVVSNL